MKKNECNFGERGDIKGHNICIRACLKKEEGGEWGRRAKEGGGGERESNRKIFKEIIAEPFQV
jgi:hypothetical protein